MHPGLLSKLFGSDNRWSGPCTVIIDAEATVQTVGSDAIVHGGVKAYGPRLITGRIAASHVRWLPEAAALLVVQSHVVRQSTGEDQLNQMLLLIDAGHVAAVEFADLKALDLLGVKPPD